MITNELEEIGFSPEEVSAYIALLELGGGYVSSIARKAGAHRVTTYNTLENLTKKGYVRVMKKKGVKFFYAISPKVILNEIEERYKKAKHLIPDLMALQNKHHFKPKIQFYDGLDEIWDIFNDLLQSRTEVLGYTNYQMAHELFPHYLERYNSTALNVKTKHRLLCPNDAYNNRYIKTHLKERIEQGILEIFAVKPGHFPFKNALYIYEDKVATISFDKDEMMGVILESISNAETNRSIFNLAWLGATSYVAR